MRKGHSSGYARISKAPQDTASQLRKAAEAAVDYGYARISKPKQSIARQIRNITEAAATRGRPVKIFQEAYTGRVMARPEWKSLLKRVKAGDTIIFDSVSRMSRNADEGVETYFDLMEKGVELIFLKEGYINTEVYKSAVAQSIAATGNEIADIYIEATNKVIRLLAAQQIRKAFEQAEKEVQDLSQRTKEGLVTAKAAGKRVGGRDPDKPVVTKKSIAAKEIIRKHSTTFGGSLSDPECIALAGCSRNSYYKYKRELIAEVNAV